MKQLGQTHLFKSISERCQEEEAGRHKCFSPIAEEEISNIIFLSNSNNFELLVLSHFNAVDYYKNAFFLYQYGSNFRSPPWEISPRAENDPIKLDFFCFTADFFFSVILLWKLLKTFYIN